MLSKVIIKNFLSIKEEQTIKINKDFTSIIGKNESGKSTILKAINKLNGYGIKNEEKNVELKSEESFIKGLFILNEEEINMFNGLIESYENQRIPFSTLEVVIKMYATRFKDKDILNQTFFYPYPENLINITDSGKGRKL